MRVAMKVSSRPNSGRRSRVDGGAGEPHPLGEGLGGEGRDGLTRIMASCLIRYTTAHRPPMGEEHWFANLLALTLSPQTRVRDLPGRYPLSASSLSGRRLPRGSRAGRCSRRRLSRCCVSQRHEPRGRESWCHESWCHEFWGHESWRRVRGGRRLRAGRLAPRAGRRPLPAHRRIGTGDRRCLRSWASTPGAVSWAPPAGGARRAPERATWPSRWRVHRGCDPP